jgi:hypothetical protein
LPDIAVSYKRAYARVKTDLFGTVWRGEEAARNSCCAIPAARVVGVLARTQSLPREAKALARLDGLPGTPRLLAKDRATLKRAWIEGRQCRSRARGTRSIFAPRAPACPLHRRLRTTTSPRSRTGS